MVGTRISEEQEGGGRWDERVVGEGENEDGCGASFGGESGRGVRRGLFKDGKISAVWRRRAPWRSG